ncbi:MAG: class I SAM-dependent methyltransferase [Gammaproteobacteria bacterium]
MRGRAGRTRESEGSQREKVSAGDKSAGRENPQLDRWAEWLLHGRDAGTSSLQRAQTEKWLNAVRDRVLALAGIRAGARVLDLGAGTGLLSHAARRLAARTGLVVACDVSRDALSECAQRAAPGPDLADIEHCVADAVALPFADSAFEAVVIRSVLIYIYDKDAAIHEIARVLSSGGCLSLFEPINDAQASFELGSDMVPDELEGMHAEVEQWYITQSAHWSSMRNFDERDLVRLCVYSGFDDVRLSYEVEVSRRRRTPAEVSRWINARRNPTAPTWIEAAEAVLGHQASCYLDGYVEHLTAKESVTVEAYAYIVARRRR